MFFVIAYDVLNDRRRQRLAKELVNWATRVQGSVFEAELDEARAAQLLERLRRIVSTEDDLRVYRLCKSCLDHSVVVRGSGFQVDPDFYQV
jgi:CRISPR-associated protein Cas2